MHHRKNQLGRALLSASLLFLGAACAAAPSVDLESSRCDLRVERCHVAGAAGETTVSGTLRSAWPLTASRRNLRVEALDASGRTLSTTQLEVREVPATSRHKRDVRLSFRGRVPAGTAHLRLCD